MEERKGNEEKEDRRKRRRRRLTNCCEIHTSENIKSGRKCSMGKSVFRRGDQRISGHCKICDR